MKLALKVALRCTIFTVVLSMRTVHSMAADVWWLRVHAELDQLQRDSNGTFSWHCIVYRQGGIAPCTFTPWCSPAVIYLIFCIKEVLCSKCNTGGTYLRVLQGQLVPSSCGQAPLSTTSFGPAPQISVGGVGGNSGQGIYDFATLW